MGFEGRKGKFEVEISAAVRGCERSRGRMIERIFFLEESRYVWCWFLFLAVMYVLSTDVVVERKEKKKVMMCGMDLP